MPELPEVETVRRSLLTLLIGKEIVGADLGYPPLLKNATSADFAALTGQRILNIIRRGKYLMFLFSGDKALIVHLRMTGQLRYEAANEPMMKHTHFVMELNDGHELRFVDPRKFGMLYLGSSGQVMADSAWSKLGPEPLAQDFTAADFTALLAQGKARAIKGWLLDQHKIAGVGNIYADEALFCAGVNPLSHCSAIPEAVGEKLFYCLREVLEKGIENRGTSLNDYVDGLGQQGSFQFQLKAYGREGEACYNCGEKIIREKVGGRSSSHCPSCQVFYTNDKA